MKLIRFGEPRREKPGVLHDDGTRIDASGAFRDWDEAFFGADGLEELRGWLRREGKAAPRVDPAVRLGPPVARPSKIVCIGVNYREHAAESGLAVPDEPVLFGKATTALCGPNDPVVIPRGGQKVDWEVELAVIIGTEARYVSESQALEFVAGYALHNDYSERAFQLERGGQWLKGKSADTFAPLGPFLATRDEVPDPQRLVLWLEVNGRERQRSTTGDMIFGVAKLVSYVSHFMTLLPGDVISTGTPPGVALGMRPTPVYLRPGDVVRLGIDGLGTSRQEVVPYGGGR